MQVIAVSTHGLSQEELEDFAESYFVCERWCGFFTTNWRKLINPTQDARELTIKHRPVRAKLEKIQVKWHVRSLPPDTFPKGFRHLHTHPLLAEVVAFQQKSKGS
jgi:ribosomal protein S2